MWCSEYPICPNVAETWLVLRGGALRIPLCADHVRWEPVRLLKPILKEATHE